MNSNNAYVREPPVARLGQRCALLLRYLAIIALGIVSILHPTLPLVVVGWILILSGCSSIFAVITGRYRFEWVALAPMITVLLISAIIYWPVSAGISIALIFALAFTLIDRLIHLSIVAHILRKLPAKNNTGR